LKIDQPHSTEADLASISSKEDCVRRQPGAVVNRQNPRPALGERISKMPVQGLAVAAPQQYTGVPGFEGLPESIESLVKARADPYQTLIITIITQNTSDINTERAFKTLSERFKIIPQALANAETSEIEECIRVGGLYQAKAKTIQTASRIILEKFGGNLSPILALPTEEARRTLMEIPGVGPKTADVVLLFSADKPTVPVDTHVNRVSKRLGLAPANGSYENVRLNLQSLFERKDYLSVHLLLIAHGRKTCKARNPHCQSCAINVYCQSNGRVA
jgi:endonuclease-3